MLTMKIDDVPQFVTADKYVVESLETKDERGEEEINMAQSQKKQARFKEGHHKSIKAFIDKQKNEWVALADLKKSLYDRTDYGGKKYLVKLAQVFRLEKKKDLGRVLLRAKK